MHAQIEPHASPVDYATPGDCKHGNGRTNPYNACCERACNKIRIASRVYKNRGAMLKVVPVAPVNFFTCLDWAVFIVIQQMDAPWAQEKKRFEEIHRST
jgi:hypothetical protein